MIGVVICYRNYPFFPTKKQQENTNVNKNQEKKNLMQWKRANYI
jgi:hypothetical protein